MYMCMYVCVCQHIFSSETTGLIEVKFHMDSPWDGGTKVCSNGPGHITKMTAMPIYGKNLKYLLRNQKVGDPETWYAALGWLVVLRLNVPVNNFSVMSGRSHRFLGN